MTRNRFDPISIPGAFSAGECQHIINYGNSLRLEEGKAYFPFDEVVQRVDHNIRKCKSVVLPRNEDTAWISERASRVIAAANTLLEFELSDKIPVEMMFVKYEVGDHFGAHMDNLGKVSIRKVSSSFQLSDPATYSGGELTVLNCSNPVQSRDRGVGTVFPSFMLHKVRAVTQGTRYALIVWAFGDKHFR